MNLKINNNSKPQRITETIEYEGFYPIIDFILFFVELGMHLTFPLHMSLPQGQTKNISIRFLVV